MMFEIVWDYAKTMSAILFFSLARFIPLYIGINGVLIFIYLMGVKTQMHLWLLAVGVVFTIAGFFLLKRMTTDKEFRNLAIGMEGLLVLMTLPTMTIFWLCEHFGK